MIWLQMIIWRVCAPIRGPRTRPCWLPPAASSPLGSSAGEVRQHEHPRVWMGVEGAQAAERLLEELVLVCRLGSVGEVLCGAVGGIGGLESDIPNVNSS